MAREQSTRARVAVPVETVHSNLIAREVAACVQRELSTFSAQIEHYKAQLLAVLQRECAARVKDVSQLLALREKDLAEREALQRTLDSLKVSLDRDGVEVLPESSTNKTITLIDGMDVLGTTLQPGDASTVSSQPIAPPSKEAAKAECEFSERDALAQRRETTRTEDVFSERGTRADLELDNKSFDRKLSSMHLQRQSTGLVNQPSVNQAAPATDSFSINEGLTFMTYCTSTRMGYHVRLVGSVPALGNWQPEKGLVLHTSAAEFPLWRLQEPIHISSDDIVEYKYVICNHDGQPSEWEGRSNRTFQPASQKLVKDVFNSYECAASLSCRSFRAMHIPASSLCREESYSLIHGFDRLSSQLLFEDFLSSYELLGSGPLGEGAFGQVWRCQAKTSKTPLECAAKFVRTGQLREHELQHILGEEGEIAIHSNLSHDYIVRLHEHFRETDTVTLVLEYCCGGDLFDAITARNGLSELATVKMLRHLLLALCYLHGHLIAHRDVKCENILLQHASVAPEENTFKLCDLGLAARVGNGLHGPVGSPDTVAPEVICGRAYGTEVDLWSAGVVVYMALVASSPWAAASTPETLRLVKAAKYSTAGPAWSGISSSAKAMVCKLMTLDPKERPSAETALADVWIDHGR